MDKDVAFIDLEARPKDLTQQNLLTNNYVFKKLRQEFSIITLYLLVAIIFTWPLILHLREMIPGRSNTPFVDALHHIWAMWNFRIELEHFQNPFVTTNLFYPYGTDLYLDDYQTFNNIIGLPLQYLFRGALDGAIAAYNLIMLVSLTTSAYSCFLLARYLLGSHPTTIWAAFFAGLSFGFSSYQFGHLIGHQSLVSLEFIPLYILFLLKALNSSRSWWRPGLVAALCLFCNAVVNLQFVILAGFFTALVIVYPLKRNSKLSSGKTLTPFVVIGRCAAIIAGGVVLSLPVFGPGFIGAFNFSKNVAAPTSGWFDADLMSYFWPSVNHPIWGSAIAPARRQWAVTYVEGSLFPTYTVLGLVLTGIFLYFRLKSKAAKARVTSEQTNMLVNSSDSIHYVPFGVLFWGLVVVVFGILSLGLSLFIAGNSIGLSLPGQLFYRIPVVNIMRALVRFGILVLLALSLLASFSLGYILRTLWAKPIKYKLRLSGPKLVQLTAILVTALLIFELLPAPYPLAEYKYSSFYNEIASEPGNFAILELPYAKSMPPWEATQIIHHKPLISGYISRIPQYPVDVMPVFQNFRVLSELAEAKLPLTTALNRVDIFSADNFNLDILRHFGVRYVLLHRESVKGDKYSPDLPPTQEQLLPEHYYLKPGEEAATLALIQRLGLGKPVYTDTYLMAFKVPDDPASAERSLIPWVEQSDWYDAEEIDGTISRAAKINTPRINLWSGKTRTENLTISWGSYQQPRKVTVLLNGKALGDWNVGVDRQTVIIPITLNQGNNQIGFKIEGSQFRPSQITGEPDDRLLSLRLFSMDISPG